MLAAALAGCGNTGTQQESVSQAAQSQEASTAPAESQASAESTGVEEIQAGTPKYVFLFIGDGMSYPPGTADQLLPQCLSGTKCRNRNCGRRRKNKTGQQK